MADYYPLITRAVAGLEKNTGEGRRALYERARNALVEQLRGVQPPLSETDITRERLALEEAIRKVESEAVRLLRGEAPAAPVLAEEPSLSDEPESDTPLPPEPPAARPPPPRSRTSERRWMNKPAEPNPGIKGFSDVVTDAENLGGAAAEAGRAARETYSSVPSPTPEFDRLEPRLEPAARRVAPPRPRTPQRRSVAQPDLGPVVESPDFDQAGYGATTPPPTRPPRSFDSPMVPDNLRQAVERARRDQYDDEEAPPILRRLMDMGGKIGIAAVLILLVSGTIWWQRHNIASMFRSVFTSSRAPTTATPREAPPPRAKITDRIGQGDASASRQPAEIPVTQRAVLYEDDPVEAAGKQYVGTVTWRAENSSPGPGQPTDRAVRADVSIPERNMTVTMTIRRNADRALPATHTIEIMFSLPPDFSNGGISEIRGLLMKQAEDTRGTSLAGLAVKVSPTFFLVGLSSASDADIQRNLQLLKERSWFDVAIVYTNGRRAILAIEKGTPGERAFADAFAAWGQ